MIGGSLEGLRLAAAAGRKPTPLHGADRADALQLQGIGQQWPSGRSNDDRWGTEGCGPPQPWPAVNQHRFTAPTERTPSRGSANNGRPPEDWPTMTIRS
jgi:hypothetical protein